MKGQTYWLTSPTLGIFSNGNDHRIPGHTARAKQIDNEQLDETSVFERNPFPLFERNFANVKYFRVVR